jgi:hypothetical protein
MRALGPIATMILEMRVADVHPFEATTGVMPIRIRPDLTLHVQGIPYDLTKAEVERIVSIIMAFAEKESARD